MSDVDPARAASEADPGGAAAPPAGSTEAPKSYLLPAILSTICCCMPIGIVAVAYGTRAATCVDRGDLEAARVASTKAKTWTLIALGLGVAVYLLNVLLSAVGSML